MVPKRFGCKRSVAESVEQDSEAGLGFVVTERAEGIVERDVGRQE